MEVAKQKTWKPTVAGIIDIIVGASGLIVVLFLIIGIMITGDVFNIPGIEYVPGYAKIYYTDVNGADQVAPVSDNIVSANGTSLGYDLPSNHYIYVTYKAKVSSAASAGTYATANQIWNGGNVNIAANNAKVTVNGQDPQNIPATVSL